MKLTCKTILTVLVICLPFLTCTQARAAHSGPYVGALLGGNAPMNAKSTDSLGDFSLTFKPALMEGGVIGWDFEPGNPVGEGRIELEYNHRSNPLDKAKYAEGNVPGGGSITADSLLLNVFGVFHDETRWAPYIGVGVGAARIEASGLTVTGQPMAGGSSTVFAYQAGCGIDVTLTDHLNLDLGYRFFSSAKPTFTEATGNSFKMDYLNHSVVLGLRVGF